MPRPIHHRVNLPLTDINVTETEIFQFHTVLDGHRHSTGWRQMPCIFDHNHVHVHTHCNSYWMIFTYFGKFLWGTKFCDYHEITKIICYMIGNYLITSSIGPFPSPSPLKSALLMDPFQKGSFMWSSVLHPSFMLISICFHPQA